MVQTNWLDWAVRKILVGTNLPEPRCRPVKAIPKCPDYKPKLSPQCQALFNLFMSRPDRCVWNYEIREKYFEGIGHIMNHTGRISDLRKYYTIKEIKKVGGSRLYRMEL